MYRAFQLLGLAAVAVWLAACATITQGTTQSVLVSTGDVTGATCTLSSSRVSTVSVVTPGAVVINKGRDPVNVSCTKDCYQPSLGVIDSKINPATAGNILLGGVIGLAIDATTGATRQYDGTVTVTMAPIPGCKPPKPAAAKTT
jgi:hypothetical protein